MWLWNLLRPHLFNGNGGMWCVAWNERRAAFFWVIEVAVEMETPSTLGRFAVSSIGCKCARIC